MAMHSFIYVTVIMALVALLLGVYIQLTEVDSIIIRPTTAQIGDEHTPLIAHTPHSLTIGKYAHAPLDLPQLMIPYSWYRNTFQLKRWVYHSIATPQYFIGFAIAHLGYIANGFAYITDRNTGVTYEFTSLAPFGIGTTFSTSSIQGCSSFQSLVGNNIIQSCATQHGYELYLQLMVHDKVNNGVSIPLIVNATLQSNPEALFFIFPHAADRHALVHKEIMAGQATIQLGESIHLQNQPSAGMIDWTFSLAHRITIWKWASLATYVDSDLVGINLSEHVYDDASGISAENAVFVNGKVYVLGDVDFVLPEEPATQTWYLRTSANSTSHVKLDLSFQPRGTREERINAGLVISDFVQPHGYFFGTITLPDGKIIRLDKAYGVCENHYAKW